jgi:hypothetical protein
LAREVKQAWAKAVMLGAWHLMVFVPGADDDGLDGSWMDGAETEDEEGAASRIAANSGRKPLEDDKHFNAEASLCNRRRLRNSHSAASDSGGDKRRRSMFPDFSTGENILFCFGFRRGQHKNRSLPKRPLHFTPLTRYLRLSPERRIVPKNIATESFDLTFVVSPKQRE